VPSNRTRSNGHKLKYRRHHQNIRKHFSTVKVIEHWHMLARKAVETPCLKIFKICLDMVKLALDNPA